jgi:hypothetical protein
MRKKSIDRRFAANHWLQRVRNPLILRDTNSGLGPVYVRFFSNLDFFRTLLEGVSRPRGARTVVGVVSRVSNAARARELQKSRFDRHRARRNERAGTFDRCTWLKAA